MICSLLLGFYATKGCWGDYSSHGIRNIDWVMLSCFIIITLIPIATYIYYLFNKKKAGRKIFDVYIWNYKIQVKFLVLELIVIVFESVLFVYSPSINSACAIGIIAMLSLNSLLSAYVIYGLFENGLIYGGKLYNWENVLWYSFGIDNLSFKVKDKRKGSVELKYYIKNNNSNEIEIYLQELVQVKKLNLLSEV